VIGLGAAWNTRTTGSYRSTAVYTGCSHESWSMQARG